MFIYNFRKYCFPSLKKASVTPNIDVLPDTRSYEQSAFYSVSTHTSAISLINSKSSFTDLASLEVPLPKPASSSSLKDTADLPKVYSV